MFRLLWLVFHYLLSKIEKFCIYHWWLKVKLAFNHCKNRMRACMWPIFVTKSSVEAKKLFLLFYENKHFHSCRSVYIWKLRYKITIWYTAGDFFIVFFGYIKFCVLPAHQSLLSVSDPLTVLHAVTQPRSQALSSPERRPWLGLVTCHPDSRW